jgi:hypothetical protein
MIRNATRTFALALTLAALMAPAGEALAQSTTPPPPPPPPTTTPTPGSVTGTNPEPKNAVVEMVLVFLHLA